MKLLLKKAEEFGVLKQMLNAVDANTSLTPLHSAVLSGAFSIIRILIGIIYISYIYIYIYI